MKKENASAEQGVRLSCSRNKISPKTQGRFPFYHHPTSDTGFFALVKFSIDVKMLRQKRKPWKLLFQYLGSMEQEKCQL
jgi:hypothetical protein